MTATASQQVWTTPGGTENLQQSWRLGQDLDTDKGNTPDGSKPCKEEVEKQGVQTLNQQSKGLGIWYSVMQAQPAIWINSSTCPNPLVIPNTLHIHTPLLLNLTVFSDLTRCCANN